MLKVDYGCIGFVMLYSTSYREPLSAMWPWAVPTLSVPQGPGRHLVRPPRFLSVVISTDSHLPGFFSPAGSGSASAEFGGSEPDLIIKSKK